MANRRRVDRGVLLTAAVLALIGSPLAIRASSQAATETFFYTGYGGSWVRITSTVYFSVKSCPGMQDAVKFTSYQFMFQETQRYGVTRFADNAASVGPICGGGSSITPIHFWADELVKYTWSSSLNLNQSGPYQSALTGFPWVVGSDFSATGLHVGIKQFVQPLPGNPIPILRYCHKNLLQGLSQGGCSRNPA